MENATRGEGRGARSKRPWLRSQSTRARAAEFKRLATEAIAAERQLHALRDRITILRRDIDKMIATGIYEEARRIGARFRNFRRAHRRVPRKATLEMPSRWLTRSTGLPKRSAQFSRPMSEPPKMSGNATHNEGHNRIQPKTQFMNLNLVLSKKTRATTEPLSDHRCRLSSSHSKIAKRSFPCLWSSTLAPTLPSMRQWDQLLARFHGHRRLGAPLARDQPKCLGGRLSRRLVPKMPPWFLPQFCSAPPSSIAQAAIAQSDREGEGRSLFPRSDAHGLDPRQSAKGLPKNASVIAGSRRVRFNRYYHLQSHGRGPTMRPSDLTAGLRKALCQAWKERRHGCGSDLRGGEPAEHAVCPGQKRRPAGCSHAASHAGAADPAADDAGERIPGASCRVQDRGRASHVVRRVTLGRVLL